MIGNRKRTFNTSKEVAVVVVRALQRVANCDSVLALSAHLDGLSRSRCARRHGVSCLFVSLLFFSFFFSFPFFPARCVSEKARKLVCMYDTREIYFLLSCVTICE